MLNGLIINRRNLFEKFFLKNGFLIKKYFFYTKQDYTEIVLSNCLQGNLGRSFTRHQSESCFLPYQTCKMEIFATIYS